MGRTHTNPSMASKDLRQRYIEHFSNSDKSNQVYFQNLVEELNPGRKIVVTSDDSGFNFLHYVKYAKDEDLVVNDLESLRRIYQVAFRHPCNWQQSSGDLHYSDTLRGWKVTWRGHEFDVIVTKWETNCGETELWHLVAEDDAYAKEFILKVMQYCLRREEDPFSVYEHGYWSTDNSMWSSIKKASWDDVNMADEVKRTLQRDYRSFFKGQKTYQRLNVPWKRGLIFHGVSEIKGGTKLTQQPPGNGKTITLKAIMNDIDVRILYVKSFHARGGDSADTDSIDEMFAHARRQSPCLLILEDLDSMISDENRSFFLNELDGVTENDGILIVGTTNHFDRLDPALSSRPSRFDRKYSFPDPSEAQRRSYAQFWQDKLQDKDTEDLEFPDSLLDEFAAGTEGFSFAYMKEAFVSALIEIAHDEEDKAMVANGNAPEPTIPFAKALIGQVKHLCREMEETKKAAEAKKETDSDSNSD